MKELEEQKDNGFITLEEYDTLRIRYERKLGNKEEVSKLQEAKGFKPSSITERKAKKEELYDDFVDKYSAIDSYDYSETKKENNSLNKRTKWTIIILLVIIAFAIGIVAGVSELNTIQNNTVPNITVTDSAFSSNATVTNATNLTANDTQNGTTPNIQKTTTRRSYSTTNTRRSSSSSSSRSSSGSSYSSSSSSNHGSSSSSGSSSSHSSSSGSSSSSSSE